MKRKIKQVEAMEELLAHCEKTGDSYKPSDADITIVALKRLVSETRKSFETHRHIAVSLIDAINRRHQAFDPLPKLATRIVNALKSSKVDKNLLEDINRIRSRFVYVSKKKAPVQASPETKPAVDHKPVAELSFGAREGNFYELIQLLRKSPTYNPSEEDLAFAGLETLHRHMCYCNSLVTDLQTKMRNAILRMNNLVYGEDGIHGIAQRVKSYYASVFGFGSEAFRMVNRIRFLPYDN